MAGAVASVAARAPMARERSVGEVHAAVAVEDPARQPRLERAEVDAVRRRRQLLAVETGRPRQKAIAVGAGAERQLHGRVRVPAVAESRRERVAAVEPDVAGRAAAEPLASSSRISQSARSSAPRAHRPAANMRAMLRTANACERRFDVVLGSSASSGGRITSAWRVVSFT